MRLTHFQSTFANVNPNLTVIGQDKYVPHGSSGTATMAIREKEEEEIKNHTGDCFHIRTHDVACFHVSSSEDACFFISAGEEDLVAEPLPQFTIDGFTEIKALSSHGLNELVVIGIYNDEEVIAKVFYNYSAQGGVGAVGGVTYFATIDSINTLLPEIEKIIYGDIVRLECWDTTSGLSELAIITSGNVYWIESVLLGISNTNIGHANATDAIDMPFFKEDTYGKNTYSETINFPPVDNPPHYVMEPDLYWVYSWAICDYDGSFHNLNSHSYPYFKSGYESVEITTNDKYSTYEQSDGVLQKTDIGSNLGENRTADLNMYAGDPIPIVIPTKYMTGAIAQMRGNVSILSNNKVVPNVSFEDGSQLTGKLSAYKEQNVGEYSECLNGGSLIGQYYVYDWSYVHFESAVLDGYPVIPDAANGVNLCCDNNFAAVAAGGEIHYINLDADIGGVITDIGSDFTVVKGVALVADGTDTVVQTVME